MGLGYQREEIEIDNFPNPDSPVRGEEGAVAGKFGVGLQGDMGRVGIRTELAYRADGDQRHPRPAAERRSAAGA